MANVHVDTSPKNKKGNILKSLIYRRYILCEMDDKKNSTIFLFVDIVEFHLSLPLSNRRNLRRLKQTTLMQSCVECHIFIYNGKIRNSGKIERSTLAIIYTSIRVSKILHVYFFPRVVYMFTFCPTFFSKFTRQESNNR